MLGQREQARQTLEAVLAEHPEHGVALRTRGQLALMDGQAAEAEKWLREAVCVLPNDYLANWVLNQSLRQQNKTAEAQVQLERAQRLKDDRERLAELTTRHMSERPHDPAIHCELGTLLIRTGHAETGLLWLHSALRQDANYRPAHTALADFYQAKGDTDRAAYHRQRAQASAPAP
jgi:predicted Zn-dependent protease